MSVIVLLGAIRAYAGDGGAPSPYALALDAAAKAILEGNLAGARGHLAEAERVAPSVSTLLLPADLARLDFYAGAAEWKLGDRDTAALNAWRRALVIDPTYAPDEVVLAESDAQDAFYAVASEVEGYPQVPLSPPEEGSAILLFVDGRRPDPEDFVHVGRHFIKLRCDDTTFAASWYTFGDAPADYLVLCQGGKYGGKPPKVKVRAPKKGAVAPVDPANAVESAVAVAGLPPPPEPVLLAPTPDDEADDRIVDTEELAVDDVGAFDPGAEEEAGRSGQRALAKLAEQAARQEAKAAADAEAMEKAYNDRLELQATADRVAKEAAENVRAAALVAAKAAAEREATAKLAPAPVAPVPVTPTPVLPVAVAADPPKKTGRPPKESHTVTTATVRHRGPGAASVGLMSVGGLLLGGGGALNFLVVEPLWAEGEAANADPAGLTRADANALQSRYDAARVATLGLLGGGVLTFGTGIVVGAVDARISLRLNGVLLSGTW